MDSMSISVTERQPRYGSSGDVALVYATLSRIVVEITSDVTEIMLSRLGMMLRDDDVKAHLDEVFPYLYTVGFLAFSGRPIDRDNMARTLRAVGMEPDDGVLNALLSTGIRNEVIYLYCLYYLRVMGREANDQSMFALLDALGIPNDAKAARSVLGMRSSGTLR